MTHSLRRRSSTLRLLGSGGLFAAIMLMSALAFAGESGTMVLSDGSVLSGEIISIHNGDHVQIKLPTGEVRAIAWAKIGTLQVGAGFVIGGGGIQPTPQPQPQPQPTYQPQPQPQPQPTYQPQPQPQPTYQPAPQPRRRAEVWTPRWELGARLMTVYSGGDILGQGQSTGLAAPTDLGVRDVIGAGGGVQFDVGLHFVPMWSGYGFLEIDSYGRGTMNNGVAGKQGTGGAIGLGLRWNSAPHHSIGLLLDGSIAARWISFGLPAGDGTSYYDATALGGEFKLAAGLSIGSNSHFRIEPAAYLAAGEYSSFDDGSCGADSYCTSLDPSQRGTYWTAGLQIGAHFDL